MKSYNHLTQKIIEKDAIIAELRVDNDRRAIENNLLRGEIEEREREIIELKINMEAYRAKLH